MFGLILWLLLLLVATAVLALAILVGFVMYEWNRASEQGKISARKAWRETKEFYRCTWYFVRGGSFADCPYFTAENGASEEVKLKKRDAKVKLFGMCLTFYLWDKPHYRHGTFQDDMKMNLRNVAIPGTGLALSVFAYHKVLAYFFVFVVYPLACFVTGLNLGRRNLKVVCDEYVVQLLNSTDWFSFWRLNCALASYHAYSTKETQYELEDKLTFLQVAKEKDVAVSPWLDLPAIICKHRNEEGGLGYKYFKNAVNGGDWIIQLVLENDESLKALLPSNAPLSTFRVITISSCGENEIKALSCVWRAGRSGALTDHSAILFDVDAERNVYKRGTTNTHWYQLGPHKIWGATLTSTHDISNHPDNGKTITGEPVDAKKIMEFARSSHESMMPRIPIVGWDVALTDKGMLLLECNLSCNFFLGSFDHKEYYDFVEKYLVQIESAKSVDSGNNAH